MRSLSSVLFALTVVACQATVAGPEVSDPPLPDESTPEEPTAKRAKAARPPTEEEGEVDALTQAPVQGGKPDERPPPSGNGVRTCGTPLTEAKPLRRSTLFPSVKPIALGRAVEDGQVGGDVWVSGTPTPPEYSGLETLFSAGPDKSGFAGLLGSTDTPTPDRHDNFALHVGGKDPIRIWADAHEPSSLRVTYLLTARQQSGVFRLDQERRADGAPPPGEDEFVRTYPASRYFGFALAVEIASPCAAGAIADVTGHRAALRDAVGVTGEMLDPRHHTALEALLVRDGATVRASLLSNEHRPAAEKLLAETTCGPRDLAACATLTDAMLAEMNATMKGTESPTYETLSSGADRSWSVDHFQVGRMAFFP